jgi:hypothetical protein
MWGVTSGRSSWSVLAQPRSLAVALTSLVARLPKGMVPLAIVLDVGQAKGTYLAASVDLWRPARRRAGRCGG